MKNLFGISACILLMIANGALAANFMWAENPRIPAFFISTGYIMGFGVSFMGLAHYLRDFVHEFLNNS